MKGERSTPSFASKHSQRKKKVVISNPDLSLSCDPMAKMGEQNTEPQVAVLHKGTEVTHTPAPSQAVLVPPCTRRCSPWPWITLANWPQLSHISSPARCPYLYLQGCVWCFPEVWKSYRSSLNLRGQAKQTGREQNSSGCLTHTGFETMYRLHYLLLNIHIVCYSLSLLILKARSETDMSWGRHKYHKVLLYLFQSPQFLKKNGNKQTKSPPTPQST